MTAVDTGSNLLWPQLQRIAAECFRGVLGQLAGFPITVDLRAVTPEDAENQRNRQVWSIFSASKGLEGDMAIACSEEAALALAQILMSEPLDSASPFDEGRRDAYEELLRQVFGQISTALKSVAEGDVEIKPGGDAPPGWPDALVSAIHITAEKLPAISLSLLVTPKLAASLKPRVPASTPAAPVPGPAQVQSPPSPVVADRASNLDLVLDVTLDATIRFGQKHMLLREILELHPGVAITLDRKVEEPVELLICGRMVARGEVVIVDGNYALRVTEIISPKQRIESLGRSS